LKEYPKEKIRFTDFSF